MAILGALATAPFVILHAHVGTTAARRGLPIVLVPVPFLLGPFIDISPILPIAPDPWPLTFFFYTVPRLGTDIIVHIPPRFGISQKPEEGNKHVEEFACNLLKGRWRAMGLHRAFRGRAFARLVLGGERGLRVVGKKQNTIIQNKPWPKGKDYLRKLHTRCQNRWRGTSVLTKGGKPPV